MQDDDVTRLLADAGMYPSTPSAALLDRVLADALKVQAGARAVSSPQPGDGLWSRFSGAFGGLPTLAGLGSATIVGLAFGYADPTTVDYLTGGLLAGISDTVDLFPSTDFLATEG